MKRLKFNHHISLVVFLYNYDSTSGPLATKENYIFIGDDYIKELLQNYIDDHRAIEENKEVAREVLKELNK